MEETGSCREIHAFPSKATWFVVVWLTLSTTALLAALYLVLNPVVPESPEGFLEMFLFCGARSEEMGQASVMLFAGGIGACIATFLAFSTHACQLKDFDPSYTIWYVGRPLLGMLVGFVFYFIIKGGLVLTSQTGEFDASDVNIWSLAGIGVLVGMFSKHAIEKLREIFRVLFKTTDQPTTSSPALLLVRQIRSLPANQRTQVIAQLGDDASVFLGSPSKDELTALFAQLSPEQIKKLRTLLGNKSDLLNPFIPAGG